MHALSLVSLAIKAKRATSVVPRVILELVPASVYVALLLYTSYRDHRPRSTTFLTVGVYFHERFHYFFLLSGR